MTDLERIGGFAETFVAEQKASKQRAQEKFLQLVSEGLTYREACEQVDRSEGTVESWRRKSPKFRQALNEINLTKAQNRPTKTVTVDGGRAVPAKGTFAEWRMKYLGRAVEPHQAPLVSALEDRTNLKVVWLAPPGAGKDTTLGDWLMYELCDDRSGLRVAWIMESDSFATRRLGRIDRYLTDHSVYKSQPEGVSSAIPTGDLIDDYGPFRWDKDMVWVDGQPVEKVPWTQHAMYFVQNLAPEADPTIWSTGVGGAIYGSRIGMLALSDPFTRENQRSAVERASQMDFIKGTVRTRLDGRGRIIVLGTRVGSDEADNYAALIKYLVGSSRIIWEGENYRKYSNGTAIVIQPAVTVGADGAEQSYWPSRFPLHDQIVLPSGKWIPKSTLTDDEVLKLGERHDVTMIEGLVNVREDDEVTFSTLYQQSPPSSVAGEFSDVILDHCDDPTRTVGVHVPGEILVLGVDPARSGGAAWVLWGISREQQTLTVLDFWYGERLGIPGICQRLIVDPITKYMPREMAYETNHEAGVLYLPEVKKVISECSVKVHEHHTHSNRSVGESSVASMSIGMRTGQIRFPAATPADRVKLRLLKQHFKNWDAATVTNRTRSGGFGHQPDDICMASWIGWIRARDLLQSGRISDIIHHVVPGVVRQRLAHMRSSAVEEKGSPPVTDVLGLFFNESDRE